MRELVGDEDVEEAAVGAEVNFGGAGRAGESIDEGDAGGVGIDAILRFGAADGVGDVGVAAVMADFHPTGAGFMSGDDGAYKLDAAVVVDGPGRERAGAGGIVEVVADEELISFHVEAEGSLCVGGDDARAGSEAIFANGEGVDDAGGFFGDDEDLAIRLKADFGGGGEIGAERPGGTA